LLKSALLALALSVAAGCATTGGGGDPRDPWESANRAMYRFNEGFDEAFGRPIATGYRDFFHAEIRDRVRNFFSNIGDLFIGVNNLLQGKLQDGLEDWARFAFNSTIGFLGIHDVASDMGLEKHNEDFGQTFGRWGVGDGPYVVFPILGSSTVRDGFGTVFDIYADPVGDFRPFRLRNSAVLLRLTNTRADLLEAGRILEEAALDKYVFQRDAYLQRRRSLIHDGRPPRDDEAGRAVREPRVAAPPVNAPAVSSVNNVYLPRVPSNYDAVMAILSRNRVDGISR
jgi:phospholipid-binding lipoprotein MlaA